MEQRPYQLKAKERIHEEWTQVDSTLLSLPTGCGKTVVFSGIIDDIQPKRTLVLAHREELIFQNYRTIEEVTSVGCEIEMADQVASANLFNSAQVIVSTVQTQIRRMHRFNPDHFGYLIIDECHHATADSYRRIIDYYRQNKSLKVLGVTATPDRADEEALGQVFQSVAFDYEILDAINDGWLVPIKQQFVFVKGLDFSGCRTTAGDLNGADLAKVMEDEKMLQGTIGASLDLIGDRRAIVFTASVRHAEMAANIFNRHKDKMADWICGTTPKDTRRDAIKKFAAGEIQVMCNCGVLLEGFDDAGVEVIVMARPTKSRCLYAQCIGRSTRPLKGLVDGLATAEERKSAIAASNKPSCLVLDFVGNSGRHKLITSADILGGKVSEQVLERAVQNVRESSEPKDMAKEINEAAAQLREEEKKRKEAEQAKRSKLIAQVHYAAKDVNPFDVFDKTPERERGWHVGRELSKKQKDVLVNSGINPDGLPFGQGKQLVDEVIYRRNEGKANFEQAKKLRAMGLSINMNELEAAKITKIAACTKKQAWRIGQAGKNPLNYTFKTAHDFIDQLNKGQTPQESPPPPKKLNGEPATDKQKKFLRHYDTSRMTKKEAKRLFLRIKQNGYRPLPLTDRDHPRNWKEPVEQGEVEAEPEPVFAQEDMF